jgi:hypothetical protein
MRALTGLLWIALAIIGGVLYVHGYWSAWIDRLMAGLTSSPASTPLTIGQSVTPSPAQWAQRRKTNP